MKNRIISAKLSDVKIKDKYIDEAFNLQLTNMLKLDDDRLLAGFRETAGLIAGMSEPQITEFMKNKQRYGGMWEDGLIGGHTLGHYLTALAQAKVNPALTAAKKKDVENRLINILEALKECQEYTKETDGEGFIFGGAFPSKEFRENPFLQFDNVEHGLQELFTQAWVPWYTMHKILSGLNAAFLIAGESLALEIANNLGIWIAKRTEGWSEEVNKTVLSIEYGGMNDCLYELYRINRELHESGKGGDHPEYERFKAAAHRFDEDSLFEKVLTGEKNLFNNVHANTTIPKFIGALARYEADHNETRYLEYAERFFDIVVSRHTYVTGGNSENEHFGEDNILDAERTNVNNETCNTYNMLKFARRLYQETGKKKYLDYAERTFINAIMASQNHETGFTTYFQAMATGYQKVFNNLDGNFWCCTGTGYENFTKLQDGIFFEDENKLVVAMYIGSEYKSENYTVSLDCDLSVSDEVKLTIRPKAGISFDKDLWLIVPTWVKGDITVVKDAKKIKATVKDGFMIITNEKLKSGCELKLTLPMGITCHNLQDGKDTYSFMYGPYVLSARLGTTKIKTKSHGVAVSVAAKKAIDNDEIVVSGESSVDDFINNIDKHLIKRDGEMEFDLSDTDKKLIFTTHYNQYKESYGIYWKLRV
ncbi:beta-L-arabinofuranosidase domain-containing protein [Butyrivibrio sp. XPD2002]|uniref:beta-L-arabinofuranosidase domain-containing protein n=1 Tax=Butyrivibrio sp. XPD2002 TaxID=1280665 RepID=UPI000406A5A5|nr:beta-L-arabinofuranosidase domain-containing protein [Butyrivibrio sp. XPD2002]